MKDQKHNWILGLSFLKNYEWGGFSGGPEVENLLAGVTGSIPGPRCSPVCQLNKPHGPQPLSRCSRACEPQFLSALSATPEAHGPAACAPQQEKPLQSDSLAPQ